MASSMSLYNTTLTLAHQRSRAISLSPTNTSSASTDRTVLRNLRSLAERTSNRSQPGDTEREELDQGLIRLVDLLQKDEKGKQMVQEIRQSHPNFALPPSQSPPQSPSNDDEPYKDDPFTSSSNSKSNSQLQEEDSRTTQDLLESQTQVFDQQDQHLDTLSLSIGRQRDLSIQMNDELELQSGLLEDLDGDVENTGLRLGRASGRLRTVERSLKEHGSTWTILLLIIILVILISIFK